MWSGKIEDYILYEDKNIIVCHKPAGLAVQNARIGSADMESALKNYLYKKEPGKMPYLGIVHRLDQPVEGILVFAHTPFAAKELSRQISSGQMEKSGSDKRKAGKTRGVTGRLSEKRRTYQYVRSCSRRHTRSKKGQAFISGDP